MQIRGEHFNRKIYSAAITDTNAHTTESIEISGLNQKSLIVVNGLDQNAAIQIQGSADNSTFISVGSPVTVNTSANAIIGIKEVAELANYFPFLRATVTAALAPTTGTITVQAVASV